MDSDDDSWLMESCNGDRLKMAQKGQIGRCTDSDDEPDTPKMQETPASFAPFAASSSSSSTSRMDGDWNKENVPIGGGGGYRDTPTNSKRGLFTTKTHSIKLLAQESSAGSSPAFENLLKRPLATVDENVGGFLKKRKYGKRGPSDGKW